MREKGGRKYVRRKARKASPPSSLRKGFFWSVRNGYLSPNTLSCSDATGSICDVSAVSPGIAPTGLARSLGLLRDLLSCTDTDKSPHKPGPQKPPPLIKVIRLWSAISNHRELLAAAKTSPLVRGLVPHHLLTNVTTDAFGFTHREPESFV